MVVARESGGSSGGGWTEGGDTCRGKYGEFSRRHTPGEDVTLGGDERTGGDQACGWI